MCIKGGARELVEGSRNWGEQALPRLSKYTYFEKAERLEDNFKKEVVHLSLGCSRGRYRRKGI